MPIPGPSVTPSNQGAYGLTQTLAVRRLASGAEDAHGNTTSTYGDAEPWEVWAYAPGANEDPAETNRDLSLIEWTVYAPVSSEAPTERDLVVIDGVDYAVEGRPKDWTHGPWEHPAAGLVVELKRAEG